MKTQRQKKIIELIENNDIETQEELAQALQDAGYNVTQATVSRDIRELKLTKTSTDGKHQKYVVFSPAEFKLSDKYVNVLKEGFLSMDTAKNLLVIRTVSGMAMAVCAAIDALEFEEEIGSIAGDDTIMLATKDDDKAISLMDKINKVIKK